MMKHLYRARHDRRIAGVCGGMAEYFGVDPSLVRLVWALGSIFVGACFLGILAYILAWAIIPEEPAGEPGR